MITEHQEQAALIAWARATESHWPELALWVWNGRK